MGTATHAGLTYAVHDGVELKGDLYLPKGEGPHPVLVGIPGGGWRRGDRSGFRIWGEHLSDQGFAFFSIDHRRSAQGKMFPQNVQDVLAAVRFVARQAADYGLDPDAIGILGSSAGAHLGSMVALAGDKPMFAEAHPDEGAAAPPIKALVAVYGPYDLYTHWQNDLRKNALPGEDYTERMLGCTPYDDPQIYVDASPLRQIRYVASALKTLIIWGTEDTEILPSQSQMFVDALRQARFFVRTLPVVGAGHFWFSEDAIEDPNGYNAALAPRIVRFLRQHLTQARLHGGG